MVVHLLGFALLVLIELLYAFLTLIAVLIQACSAVRHNNKLWICVAVEA